MSIVSECNEHIDLRTSLVRYFKLPAVLLLTDFEPPSDEMFESGKLLYWSEALEEAVEEARDEDARIIGRRRSL
jgi:hypothetical protein